MYVQMQNAIQKPDQAKSFEFKVEIKQLTNPSQVGAILKRKIKMDIIGAGRNSLKIEHISCIQ